MSLVARYLEANSMPTVIIGSALDVIEQCGVPRFLFVDFPLGNPCGPPDRRDLQEAIVHQGLGLLETADRPRVTVTSPVAWPTEPGSVWRPRYGRVEPAERDRLLALGEERRKRWAQRIKKA